MRAPALRDVPPDDRGPQDLMSALRRYLQRPDVRRAPLHLLGRRLRLELERRLWSRRLDADHRGRFDGDLVMSLRLSDVDRKSVV